ncbi:MAG: PH domain-containing protein [bacterium]
MHNVFELKPNEHVLGIIRRSLWAESHRIILSIVWVLIPFFLFFPLIGIGVFGWSLFVAVLGSGILFALKTWLVWRYTMIVITDQRMVDAEQRGFFNRTVSDLEVDNIGEVVSRRRGILRRIFDIGTIRIKTRKGFEFDLELPGVRHPDRVRDFLDEVQCVLEEELEKVEDVESVEDIEVEEESEIETVEPVEPVPDSETEFERKTIIT